MRLEELPQISTNSESEELIKKLALKAGREVSLINKRPDGSSSLEVEGELKYDLQIGDTIEIGKRVTSPIEKIWEENGEYFVQTESSSIYQLTIEGENNETQEVVGDIEKNLKEQPQSIQDMLMDSEKEPKHSVKFEEVKEIDGKEFMFAGISGGSDLISLVRDEKDPNKFKTRAFRFSGSDHQWKVVPGWREGGDAVMKGDENNPMHHYVQSAKLHKDMYKIINNLPKVDWYPAQKYLPEEKGKYSNEIEFKEEYLELKNSEWKTYQNFCQNFYKFYDRLVLGAGNHIFSLEDGLYKTLKRYDYVPEFKKMADYIEKINANPEYKEKIKNLKLTELSRDSDPELRKISEMYQENISAYIESRFDGKVFTKNLGSTNSGPTNINFPETLLPDFSLQNRIDAYEKPDIKSDGKDVVKIEEYAVKSPEGDNLVFAMAYDSKGRVYIDNIYDPTVGMNDYGIPSKICQMGHLVYKPEDYEEQANWGFPKKYVTKMESYKYVDISKLWEKLPPIKKFKEELQRRGILK